MEQGWFGLRTAVMEALEEIGADKNDEGHFMIFEKPVIAGLDPEEVVVPAESEYSVDGNRRNLAATLNNRGAGLSIAVIA